MKPSILDFGPELPDGRSRFNVQCGLVDPDIAALIDRLTRAVVHWTPAADSVRRDAVILAEAFTRVGK